MPRLTKFLAIALVLQVVLVAVVWTRDDAPTIGRLGAVVDLAAEQITRIQIAAGAPGGDAAAATAPAIDLVKQEGGWTLASHFGYPASAERVDALIEKLAGMKSRGPVATGAARGRQLEVADDAFLRKVTVTQGGKDVVVYLGAPAGPRTAAVRLGGSDAVHGVAGVSAAGVSAEPSAYVDPIYVELDPGRVVALEVTNARGAFSLSKESGDWVPMLNGKPIPAPAGKQLDLGKLDQWARTVATGLELVAPADPARALPSPEATITLRLGAEPTPPTGDEHGEEAVDTGDGAAAVSTAGDERVFDVVSDKDGRYYVRERGSPRAVLVDVGKLRELVELEAEDVFGDPNAKPSAKPGMQSGGIPPEVLEQLRQQGMMP